MSVSLLISLLAAIFAAPWWVHTAYRSSHRWQELQVKMDNAAIELARHDAGLMIEIERARRQVESLEIPHHVAHLCARTSASCWSADRVAERSISLFVDGFEKSVRLRWRSAGARFGARAPASLLGRPPDVPWVIHRCPLCGLRTKWEIPVSEFRWHAESLSPALRTSAKVAKGEEGWTFRLLPTGAM